MRVVMILIVMMGHLMAHGGAPHDASGEKTYRFGGFLDLQYRSDDLYPAGPKGSSGYELHGEPEKVEAEHIGLYMETLWADRWEGVLELNRHNVAEDTLDQTVERCFGGFREKSFRVRAGRQEQGVSFVSEKAWGYGFSQMPLGLESAFGSSFYGDGVSVRAGNEYVSIRWDTMRDMYTDAPRSGVKLKGMFELSPFRADLIGYYQRQGSSQQRKDTAAVQHSHTHGSGCDNLSSTELCFELERSVYGGGVALESEPLSIQAEWIVSDDEGTVQSSQYLIERNSQNHTLYLQGLFRVAQFELGVRRELFWYGDRYEGSGSTEIAEQLGLSDKKEAYELLDTAVVGYSLGEYGIVRLEWSGDGDEAIMRIQSFLKLEIF